MRNKRLLFVFGFLSICIFINLDFKFIKTNAEIIRVISEDENEIGIIDSPPMPSRSIMSPQFSKDGIIYLVNPIYSKNYGFCLYDKKINLLKLLKPIPGNENIIGYRSIHITENKSILCYDIGEEIIRYNDNGQKIYQLKPIDTGKNKPIFFYWSFKEYLLLYDDSGNPLIFNELGKRLNEDETVQVIAETQQTNELLVDPILGKKIKDFLAKNKIYFLYDNIFPENSKLYMEYLYLLNPGLFSIKIDDIDLSKTNEYALYYVKQTDKYGNIYFDYLNKKTNKYYLFILSKRAEMLAILDYTIPREGQSFFVNYNNGDLYFMSLELNKRNYVFSYINNTWQPIVSNQIISYKNTTKQVAKISSSSMLTEKFDKNMYQPVKAFDGKPDTGWMEGIKGPGIGEWIEVKFDKPVTAEKLIVSPGWFDSSYWAQNNRIRNIRIELDDYNQDAAFTDKMTPQEVKLPAAKTFSRARFIVKDVYPSGKDNDTCISEIEFWNAGKKLELDLSAFTDQLKVVPQ